MRHPLTDAVAGLVAFTWLRTGWPGLAGLAGGVLAALAGLRLIRPAWFTRLVSGPARNRWRWWFYRRHWHAVMTIARLAPLYRGRVVVPLLGKVTATGCTDRVAVRLVSGQSPADFAARAEGIAHGFRAHLCRVRSSAPGTVVLELVRRDALADPMPALPIPDMTDPRALPAGRREDGTPFAIRLQGTRLLIAGATGAGQGVVPVGPGPRDAARDGGRARPPLGVRPEAHGAGVRPGAVRPVRPVRRLPRRHRRTARSRR